MGIFQPEIHGYSRVRNHEPRYSRFRVMFSAVFADNRLGVWPNRVLENGSDTELNLRRDKSCRQGTERQEEADGAERLRSLRVTSPWSSESLVPASAVFKNPAGEPRLRISNGLQ